MCCLLHARARGTLFTTARNAALQRGAPSLFCDTWCSSLECVSRWYSCVVASHVLFGGVANNFIWCGDGHHCVFARRSILRYMFTDVRPYPTASHARTCALLRCKTRLAWAARAAATKR
eukprot:4440381-Pleurochrysis_carterae.AAC.2